MKRLIYLDAGVLIGAARGDAEVALHAFEIINDPDASFSSSVFVQLETIPKATYNKKQFELQFYEKFFASVSVWAEPNDELTAVALREGSDFGLGAMDALHVASAIVTKSQELVTSESQTKPIHRAKRIDVLTIAR